MNPIGLESDIRNLELMISQASFHGQRVYASSSSRQEEPLIITETYVIDEQNKIKVVWPSHHKDSENYDFEI